jgi:hypothetical protein
MTSNVIYGTSRKDGKITKEASSHNDNFTEGASRNDNIAKTASRNNKNMT